VPKPLALAHPAEIIFSPLPSRRPQTVFGTLTDDGCNVRFAGASFFRRRCLHLPSRRTGGLGLFSFSPAMSSPSDLGSCIAIEWIAALSRQSVEKILPILLIQRFLSGPPLAEDACDLSAN